MQVSVLLTINIPTYNRSKYLDRCLKHLLFQKVDFLNQIEINVYDNNSSDNTSAVVELYKVDEVPLNYIKNNTNIGPDRNIGQCYFKAKGKYVLVLGDDDILLPGSIKHILSILNNGNYGLVHLNFYSFKTDFVKEKPIQLNKKSYLYEGENILRYVLSNVALISANIVNTKFISEVDIDETTNTNLNQLPGILKAASHGGLNVYINKYFLAQQAENSGGFEYFDVFGVNFPLLVNRYLSNNGSGKNWIKGHLIKQVVPFPLHQLLKKDKRKTREVLERILPYFKSSFTFWLTIYPIAKSPKILSYIFLKIAQVYNKLYYLFSNIHVGKEID